INSLHNSEKDERLSEHPFHLQQVTLRYNIQTSSINHHTGRCREEWPAEDGTDFLSWQVWFKKYHFLSENAEAYGLR
ncbi:hypothetical protein L9F63_003968, partial [Diploptera punctata]